MNYNDRNPRRVPRRSLVEKALIASGMAATAAIAGSAYAVLDEHAFKEPSSAAEPKPGPEINGTVATARSALLPAATPETTRTITLEATTVTVDVAAGVKYNAWTFGGTVPGPFIRVKQGDTINFTFKNSGREGHSIDFHAAQTPWNVNYKTILPGQDLSFTWKASFPGVFMYHCGTGPVLHHIANGMYGAVIVDPATPFGAATEIALVQSEFYAMKGDGGSWDGDMDKMKAATPDLLAFNGTAFQYRDQPIQVKAGQPIRMYVCNAGPTLMSAFHVIGAIFDRVYIDGNPANALQGVSTYPIAPGQGCTFELTIPEPGQYPFVTHNMAYMDLGAVGLLSAT